MDAPRSVSNRLLPLEPAADLTEVVRPSSAVLPGQPIGDLLVDQPISSKRPCAASVRCRPRARGLPRCARDDGPGAGDAGTESQLRNLAITGSALACGVLSISFVVLASHKLGSSSRSTGPRARATLRARSARVEAAYLATMSRLFQPTTVMRSVSWIPAAASSGRRHGGTGADAVDH